MLKITEEYEQHNLLASIEAGSCAKSFSETASTILAMALML